MAVKRPNWETPPEDTETATTSESEIELPPVRYLTREESRAFFDEQVRDLLGMSGEEFIARCDAGEYDDVFDDGDHADHMYLAILGGIWANQPEPTPKGLPFSHRRGKTTPTGRQAEEGSDFELPAVRTMTLEEGEAFFDAQARQLLGISGATFIERYYAGDYDDVFDDPEHRDVLYLAMLGTVGRSK